MQRLRLALAVLLAVCVLAPARAQEPPPYRILVTNDDGVRAPGLAAVAQVLQAIGNVIIVAPTDNQSGKGHSVVTTEPIWREDVTLANGLRAIGLTATPVTAVSVAIRNILTSRPDLIVSGINRGYNTALQSYLSGTVGAARAGAMFGIPAIAASLSDAGAPQDYVYAAEEVLGVARRVKQYGIPANTFLVVNIPPMPDGGYKGYAVTTQALLSGGEETFAQTIHPGTGRTIYWSVFREGMNGPEGTDLWAVANGLVAVTPMKVGETDTTQLDRLRSIFSQ